MKYTVGFNSQRNTNYHKVIPHSKRELKSAEDNLFFLGHGENNSPIYSDFGNRMAWRYFLASLHSKK
jgi:hypothetical protein